MVGAIKPPNLLSRLNFPLSTYVFGSKSQSSLNLYSSSFVLDVAGSTSDNKLRTEGLHLILRASCKRRYSTQVWMFRDEGFLTCEIKGVAVQVRRVHVHSCVEALMQRVF